MEAKRIALTGGIATGKSTVARMFEDLGATVLDADRVARQMVEPGQPCWQKLRCLLGAEYFDPDSGRLLRKKLRDRIIEEPECRSRINALLHPAILSDMEEQWRLRLREHPGQIVIFDIPLLFEIDMAARFDTVILVYVPEDIQIPRLMKRDGLTRQEAKETIRMQMPIEIKKGRADILIDNSLTPEQTRDQVRHVWEKLLAGE